MPIQERESYEIRGSHTENRTHFEDFFKNKMVFTEEEEEFYETRGLETKNPGHLRSIGRNSAMVLMG